KAGAASIMIEDQVAPKRCGHMSGKHIVPIDEFIAKIKAAVDARKDEDLTILARTDAIAVKNLEGAETPEEIEKLPKLIKAPLLANMIPGGKTPLLTAAELQALGYACVIWP